MKERHSDTFVHGVTCWLAQLELLNELLGWISTIGYNRRAR